MVHPKERRSDADRLDIPASVDLEGPKKLQATLTKFEGILEMMKPKATASKRPPNETASRYRNRFFGLAFEG